MCKFCRNSFSMALEQLRFFCNLFTPACQLKYHFRCLESVMLLITLRFTNLLLRGFSYITDHVEWFLSLAVVVFGAIRQKKRGQFQQRWCPNMFRWRSFWKKIRISWNQSANKLQIKRDIQSERKAMVGEPKSYHKNPETSYLEEELSGIQNAAMVLISRDQINEVWRFPKM